jgi:hypothetical protein
VPGAVVVAPTTVVVLFGPSPRAEVTKPLSLQQTQGDSPVTTSSSRRAVSLRNSRVTPACRSQMAIYELFCAAGRRPGNPSRSPSPEAVADNGEFVGDEGVEARLCVPRPT